METGRTLTMCSFLPIFSQPCIYLRRTLFKRWAAPAVDLEVFCINRALTILVEDATVLRDPNDKQLKALSKTFSVWPCLATWADTNFSLLNLNDWARAISRYLFAIQTDPLSMKQLELLPAACR